MTKGDLLCVWGALGLFYVVVFCFTWLIMSLFYSHVFCRALCNLVTAEGWGQLFFFHLSFFRNSITELCVPLCLPEIKLLDVSKNSVENIYADFLIGCPKLETFSVSMNKICECYQLIIRFKICSCKEFGLLCSLWTLRPWIRLCAQTKQMGLISKQYTKYLSMFNQNRFPSETH